MLHNTDPKTAIIKSKDNHGTNTKIFKKDSPLKTDGPASESGMRKEEHKISTEASIKSCKGTLYQSDIKEGPHITAPFFPDHKTTSQDNSVTTAKGGDKRFY